MFDDFEIIVELDAFDSFDGVTHTDAVSALPMLQMIDVDSGEHNLLLDIDRAAAELGEWATGEAL